MEADNLKRNSTAKGALLMLVGLVAIIAIAAYVILNPDILENILHIVLIVIVAILAIVLIVFAVMIVLAIPMYAYKGEQYQDGSSYDLDDVESVKESISDENEEK